MSNVVQFPVIPRPLPRALPDAPSAEKAFAAAILVCSLSTRLAIVNELSQLNAMLIRNKLPEIDYGQ
jgi:hypothetical protein